MGNKKYFWLKLKEDFFDEKQIKFLRSLPDGDKLVIVYLKMQLKSLRTEGFIKYDQILPSGEEELAMILDEDTNVVKLTVGALLRMGAVEKLDDGSFYMIAMQNLIGKEGESAERVRQFRKKQEQLALQCNNDVTKCNTEIEIDTEKEIEQEIELEIKKDTKKKASTHYQKIIDIYNSYCVNLPKIQKLTDKRKAAINKLLKEFTVEQFQEICINANESGFLIGHNDRGWTADFDFIIRPDKAVKILEGQYNNKRADKMDGFKRMWEEARREDEQTGNSTSNNSFGW